MECLFAAGEACAFDSSATAAWLQAIFSVVAIIFAVLIPVGMQRRREAHHRRALAILCRNGYAQICGAWQIGEKPEGDNLEMAEGQMDALRASANELRSYPVIETDRPAAMSAVRALAGHMDGAAERLGDFLTSNDPEDLKRLTNITMTCLPHLRRALLDLGVGLGDVPAGDVADRWPDHPMGKG